MPVPKTRRLLAIIEDVYKGGQDIIGPQWTLLDTMRRYAEHEDVEGMKRYYDRCLSSSKGRGVAERLKRAGRKTLESEYIGFLKIFDETP